MGDSSLQSVLSDDEGFEILDTSPSMELMVLRNGSPCLKTDTVDRHVAAPRRPTVTSVLVNGDAARPSLSNSMEDPLFRSFKAPALNNFMIEPELTEANFASMSSMQSSVYQGEIPERLSALLQENKELKDILQKNNVSMREQFSLLMTWQEGLKKFQQNQNHKLVETKELMTRLKLENAELKKSAMTTIESDLRNENDILRKKLETVEKEGLQKSYQTSIDNSIKNDKAALTDQLRAAYMSCREMSLEKQNLTEQFSHVSAHVDSLNEKINEREAELVKAKEENKVLYNRNQELEKKLAENKRECNQTRLLVVDLRAEEELRREELRTIQNQLAELQADKNSFEIINNTPLSASSANFSENTEIVKRLKEQIRVLNTQLERTQKDLVIVQERLHITQKDYETAIKEIVALKNTELVITLKEQICILETQLESTQRDLKIVQENLETAQSENQTIAKESITKEMEATRNTELVTSLKKNICSLEDQVESTLNDLKVSQERLNTVLNDTEILRSQLIVAQANKVNLCLKSFEPTEQLSLDETTTLVMTKVTLYEKYLKNIVDVYNQHQERQAFLLCSVTRALENTEHTQAYHEALTELKRIALIYQTDIVPEREMLVDAHNQFRIIFQEFKLLANELQDVKNGREASTIATKNMLVEQERKFSEQIDSLHAQLITKDEAITQKEQDRARILEELVVVKQQNESIDILKAQLELYKSDFEQERSQRQNIAIEREQIAEDLRLLQRRNEQLIKEVQEARSAEGATGPHPAASVQPPSTAPRRSASPEAALRFTCPMCYDRFRTYHILQEHVENCGDDI